MNTHTHCHRNGDLNGNGKDTQSLIAASALSANDKKILFALSQRMGATGATTTSAATLAKSAGLRSREAEASISFLRGTGVLRAAEMDGKLRIEINRRALEVEPKNPNAEAEADHGSYEIIETDDGLEVRISFKKQPTPSKSGKLLELFSTQGFQCIHAKFNERPIVFSCYCGVKV